MRAPIFFVLVLLTGALHKPLAHSEPTFYPRSVACILHADAKLKPRDGAVKTIAESDRDLIILDYSYTGSRFEKWTSQEIEVIRSARKGRRVMAHLSIGEAESDRAYWQPAWDRDHDGRPDKGAPEFLLGVNPNSVGHYRVKYWNEKWQQIILRYIDETIQQGFDGLYIDIVDAFQFFEYNPRNNKWIYRKLNPDSGQSYREDMVDWVFHITQHARKRVKGFLVIPQNGSELLEFPAFLSSIDGMGLENLYTEDNKRQPEERSHYVLKNIEPLIKMGRPVWTIEYATNESTQKYARDKALEQKLVLLVTDRGLKTLGQGGR